jgi:hypothetical protein
VLRCAWLGIGLSWAASRHNALNGGATSKVPGAPMSAAAANPIDTASITIVPTLSKSHTDAMTTLRSRIAARCGHGAFREADGGEPYTLVKEALLSPSGGVVPIGDPRAKAATAYLHRASTGPNYLVAKVDVATGEYSEQPIDERHWRLVVG